MLTLSQKVFDPRAYLSTEYGVCDDQLNKLSQPCKSVIISSHKGTPPLCRIAEKAFEIKEIASNACVNSVGRVAEPFAQKVGFPISHSFSAKPTPCGDPHAVTQTPDETTEMPGESGNNDARPV